jgi:hypothetical protein
MSVNVVTSRSLHNCNGAAVDFTFTFPIQLTSDIKVVKTTAGVSTLLTEVTHYTVDAPNDDFSSGGTVTTIATYAAGTVLTLYRDVPYTQGSDFTDSMPSLYDTFERGLDKLTMLTQQLKDWMERSLYVGEEESTTIDLELPIAADRASKYLAFNASGEPIASAGPVAGVAVSAFASTILDDANAAAVRTTIGLGNVTDVAQLPLSYLDTDVALAADSDVKVPSQKAVKAYVDGSAGHSNDYVKVSDVKAQNTSGGTFTAGAWRTRDIQTEDSDVAGICSIAANRITLAVGTYECMISAPCHFTGSHQARLYNITGAAVLLLGTTEYSDYSFSTSRSIICGKFVLAAPSALEIQHYSQVTRAGSGFGTAANIGDEVYTVAEFRRVG